MLIELLGKSRRRCRARQHVQLSHVPLPSTLGDERCRLAGIGGTCGPACVEQFVPPSVDPSCCEAAA